MRGPPIEEARMDMPTQAQLDQLAVLRKIQGSLHALNSAAAIIAVLLVVILVRIW
jgi:hypothetical protein